MSILLTNKNILESDAKAIVLTIDGYKEGMEGNIARAFALKYPNVYDEVEAELIYPISIGTISHIKVDKSLECNFSDIIFASTLDHKDILSDLQRCQSVSNAFSEVISLISKRNISSVTTAVMTGGWRLPFDIAFRHMIEGYQKTKYNLKRIPVIEICIFDKKDYEKAIKIALELGLSHTESKKKEL